MTSSSVPSDTRRPWCRLARAMVAVALCISSLATVAALPAHADVTFDQQLLTLVNQDRAANGLGPVALSPVMASIAGDRPYSGCGYTVAGRAADMGGRNYFSHTIPNCGNRGVFDMLNSAGLSYTWAAENIAWSAGITDPAAAARMANDQFMNSPPHRANLLDPNATHVGVGSWRTAAGQTWSGGGGANSNVYVTAVVLARLSSATAQAPSPPPHVSAVPADGSARVAWSPAPANGATVDTYIVYAAGPNGFTGQYALACGSCTSATVTGLANGGSYYFLVYARNAVNWGTPGVSPWIVAGAPLAPGWVSAAPTSGQVAVGWGPAPANGSPVDVYIVLAYDASGYAGQYALGCATCANAVVTGLLHGHGYYMAVYAHNARGWGAPATTASLTVP